MTELKISLLQFFKCQKIVSKISLDLIKSLRLVTSKPFRNCLKLRHVNLEVKQLFFKVWTNPSSHLIAASKFHSLRLPWFCRFNGLQFYLIRLEEFCQSISLLKCQVIKVVQDFQLMTNKLNRGRGGKLLNHAWRSGLIFQQGLLLIEVLEEKNLLHLCSLAKGSLNFKTFSLLQ